MNRYAGRRVAGRAPRRSGQVGRPGRGGFAALLVVLVTAAALVVAGTSGTPTAQPLPTTRATAVPRDLSCPGGLPGAKAVVGSIAPQGPGTTTVDGRPLDVRTSVPIARSTARVDADADAAPHVYAVRAATGKSWLAAAGCPAPRAQWWFVGAGGSGVHGSVLQLANPREGTAVVDVDVLGPHGPVTAPGLHGVQVPSHHTVALDLAKVAPAVGDLAVHVVATRGLVSASAAEHWAPTFIAEPARAWVAGQRPASRSLTLTGLAPHTRHATLLIANPSAKEAVAKVALVGSGGTFAPTRHDVVTVAPGRVTAVELDDVLRAHPVAVRIQAQVPLAATVRSQAGGDEAYAWATAPVGAHALAGVPGGTHASVQLVSLRGDRAAASSGDAAAAAPDRFTVTSFDAQGRQLRDKTVEVPAGGSASAHLPARAAAVRLSAASPERAGRHVVASLALHKGTGRVAVVPLVSTENGTHVPVVRPRW